MFRSRDQHQTWAPLRPWHCCRSSSPRNAASRHSDTRSIYPRNCKWNDGISVHDVTKQCLCRWIMLCVTQDSTCMYVQVLTAAGRHRRCTVRCYSRHTGSRGSSRHRATSPWRYASHYMLVHETYRNRFSSDKQAWLYMYTCTCMYTNIRK